MEDNKILAAINKLIRKIEDVGYEADIIKDNLEEYYSTKSINTDRMVDDQKFKLIKEHWEYITLEDIENLLKSKGRI